MTYKAEIDIDFGACSNGVLGLAPNVGNLNVVKQFSKVYSARQLYYIYKSNELNIELNKALKLASNVGNLNVVKQFSKFILLVNCIIYKSNKLNIELNKKCKLAPNVVD